MKRLYEIENKSLGTVEEAAKLVGVSRRHMYALCASGAVKAARIGNVWRVNMDELRKALALSE